MDIKQGDPIGMAILEYIQSPSDEEIIVSSDLCDDDAIPVKLLFRSLEEMPDIEQKALALCKGDVLEVGAGAGVHALELIKKGHNITAIDISNGAVQYLKKLGINSEQINFFDFKSKKFDTILLLMNGIGISKNLETLPLFLEHAKTLLNPNGQIICDSTDVSYIYEDEEDSIWVNLNASYQGDFKFKMKYKDDETEWFEWLYVDFDNLEKAAEKTGFRAKKAIEEEDRYLAVLTLIDQKK